MDNHILALLLESTGSTTMWQFSSDIRFFAMLYFGGFPMLPATIAAIAGATLGSMINFGLGWVLTRVQEQGISVLPQKMYALWHERFNWLVWIVGLLSFVHLINILIFAIGFFRISPQKALLAVVSSQALYYGYYFQHVA